MSVSSTAILAAQYMALQTKAELLLGSGAGNSGYGQTLSSTLVQAGATITKAQWDQLRLDIINIRLHQDGVVPGIVQVAVGDVIQGSGATPVLNYDTLLNQAIPNKFALADSQRIVTARAVSTYNQSWSTDLQATLQIVFASADEGRYFFNSGGKIRVTTSHAGGSVTDQVSAWAAALAFAGTQSLGAVGAATNVGITNAEYFVSEFDLAEFSFVPASGLIGYYDLIDVYQPYFTTILRPPYGASFYKLEARCNVVNNTSGSATSLQIRITLQDGYTSFPPPPLDNVDGTISISVDELKASGNLLPSGNFSIVSPSYNLSAIDVVTQPTAAYAVVASTAAVNEGASVTFTVTTSLVANGTTLYWTTQTISGTINAADFTDNTLTGSFSINSNSGTVTRTITADATTEGVESFRLQIRTVSISGTVQVTSDTVTINDTSSTPSYAISTSAAAVNEGASVTFTVTTANVVNGTTLYWSTNSVSGTITAGDFTDNTLTGSFSINSNSGTVTRTITADATTEGVESFTLSIRTVSVSGAVQVTSGTVTINDTSLTPPPPPPQLVIARFTSEGVSSQNSVQQSTIEFQIQGNPAGPYNYSLVTVPAGLAAAINTPTGTITLPGTNRALFGQPIPHAGFTATVTLSRAGYQSAVATVSVAAASAVLPQLNIDFRVLYNYKFPPRTVIGGYQQQGTYTSAPETKAYYASLLPGNNPGLAPGQITGSLNVGGLVLQGIQPENEWSEADFAVATGGHRQPWSTVGQLGGTPGNGLGFGGGPVIFVFQAPHTSPTTITLNLTAPGYAPYSQTRTVPANNLYSPYNLARGMPQEAAQNFTIQNIGVGQQVEFYYNTGGAFNLPQPIGGLSQVWGLARAADIGGLGYWTNWSITTGNAVGSDTWLMVFFGTVHAQNQEWTRRAAQGVKGFSPGTGWNRFFDRP